MAALLEANAEELARLRRQPEQPRSPPMDRPTNTENGTTSSTEAPAPNDGAGGEEQAPSHNPGQEQTEEISWPVSSPNF